MSSIRKFHSQAGQDEWVIRRVFDYKTGGYFVDAGAFDGVHLSNTYWLERNLGWSGLCIEADPRTFEKLRHARRCACANACLGPAGGQVEFVTGRGPYSGASETRRSMEMLEDEGAAIKCMPTTPLGQLLDEHGAPEVIDYLSVDVEGMEEGVMATFPFERRYFLCATIERPSPALRTLLSDKGYILVADQPGMDAFYLHPDMSASYVGKILRDSAFAGRGLIGRFTETMRQAASRGLRSSLRRL
jgi:FkbM family methyltransferase